VRRVQGEERKRKRKREKECDFCQGYDRATYKAMTFRHILTTQLSHRENKKEERMGTQTRCPHASFRGRTLMKLPLETRKILQHDLVGRHSSSRRRRRRRRR
jgi:hypothetical protein